MKRGNLGKLTLSISEWEKKPLLNLTFYISSVRDMLFLPGISQGMLKRDVSGNHEPTVISSRILHHKLLSYYKSRNETETIYALKLLANLV